MFTRILEISKRAIKGGRVPIKIALLKIHDDPNETNDNGLHWDETCVLNAKDSAKLMPICVSFVDETKSTPLDHGYTGTILTDDGIQEPVFENSETVGVIESTEIETVTVDNSEIKVLAGTGYLYMQRYPNFVKWVRENFALGKIDTSIELMGLPSNNNQLKYLEETPTEEFRTPSEFVFSGTAILSVLPADSNAILLEVAQKINKEEKFNMEEKELKALIQSAISESNSKNDELTTKIDELNTQLSDKEGEIFELNASVSQLQKALDDLKAEHETYWQERDLLEKELVKAKVATKLGELDSTIGEFNEAEQEPVKEDINTLKANIEACAKVEEFESFTSEINSIKAKICTAIVERQKKAEADAKVAEQNSANTETVDIFSEINSAEDDDNEDVNIF
ncbi:hypothetical protein [Kineothrix sedimenti]|uniref:Uncharacterized protein n=1 Tax=Kineothrix sedimenti TaxID=3123317 RepID=A0ABZ3EZZ0_9FIRM